MKKNNNYYHHDEHHHGPGRGEGRGYGRGIHGHQDDHGEYHHTGRGKGRHHDHDHDHEHAGRNKGGAFGPTGYCVCVKCGYKTEHQRGVKCTTLKCPECGHVMARQELLDEKKKNK